MHAITLPGHVIYTIVNLKLNLTFLQVRHSKINQKRYSLLLQGGRSSLNAH